MKLQNLLKLYKDESISVLEELDMSSVEKFVELILHSYHNCQNIFMIGNGGNAAFVDNFVTDLNFHPFCSDNKDVPLNITKRIRAFNLCLSPSTLTGILNDFGSNEIFTQQLKVYSTQGDVLIGFSGSGNSKNILSAFNYAKENNIKTVLFTRNKDGLCHAVSDIIIYIPGTSSFPGQTGGNNNNFHYEDMISKISHITTGILKLEVTKN